MKPTIGRIVHYRSHGSADGVYKPECVPAIVTRVSGEAISLTVFNPEGILCKQGIRQDEGAETLGTADCANSGRHGDLPFRYCQCGWAEASMKGGTWHWPCDGEAPKPVSVGAALAPEDLRIETISVGSSYTAKITHLPTGTSFSAMSASSSQARSDALESLTRILAHGAVAHEH